VFDWVRGLIPFGGFTWGSLGVSQVDNPATVRLAVVVGSLGVTFVVALVNALLTEALVGGGGVRRRAGAVVVAIGLALTPIVVPFAAAGGEPIDVATIQVDVREARGSTSTEVDIDIARMHVERHLALAGEGPAPDLVVWGEGALDPGAAADPATMEAVLGAIRAVGAPTLIGAVLNDPDGSQHTSVLLFDGQGRLVDRYDKAHLVPFGEYVPFRRWLRWIDATAQIPVDRVPGERVETLAVDGLPTFGVPICYENSFPELSRDVVRQGAAFLIVTVNNASYDLTAASAQHLQMTRIRAIETGRWSVNAAISGISAFVGPDGRVDLSAGLFEPATLRGAIAASDATTFAVRSGWAFPWACVALVLLAIAVPRGRVRSRPVPHPLPPGTRTLVILPTYDERATIEQVLRGVLARPEAVDALVVDDASPDGTGALVARLEEGEPRIRLLARPEKSGLASAYLAGFRIGLDEGYDLVVEMDSDLSHDPDELSGLLETAARGADLVVGSRYVPGGSVTNWSRARLALSRGGNTYARLLLGFPLHDATSGYRVYRRDLLERLVEHPFVSDGYGFQVELVLRTWEDGWTVAEHPITFREREHGHSKISRRIVVEALWLVTRWGLRRRLRGNPALEDDAEEGKRR
jgi:apolipoprotein N-acyltransferase